MTANRLRLALGAYGILAVAAIPVRETNVRLALWIFLAGLALKSVIAYYQSRGGE